MSSRNRKCLPPKDGWAIYLRISNKEAQNPENSQRRQRYAIERSLLERSPRPVISEYIDIFSGLSSENRSSYQRMLKDARAGCFSFVAVENAERFGRNDTEALVAIDELHELGVAVRFADYPDLDPMDPDDRVMVTLLFSMGRRESAKLAERVRGGLHAKLRSGGFTGVAPDGYKNCEAKTEAANAVHNGKYTRWVEQDPERIHIWRKAWDLLLEDRLTLDEICEELHKLGYTYRSGRPFVAVKANGKRHANKNTLSHIFHNWFYAGWVVSKKAGIPPKTVLGHWKPLVTIQEFEQGLQILARRSKHRIAKRRHDYLLKGIIYIQLPHKRKLVKLTGSTSNTYRPGGGTAYYCIPGSNVNILCRVIDEQIAPSLMNIQVDPEIVPLIRDCYTDDIAWKLGRLKPDERNELEAALRDVDFEEERTALLYAKGKITEYIWNNLWAGWQDWRRSLIVSLEALNNKQEYHINNLNDALTLIAKVGILYEQLERSDQKELLRQMVKRVVVNSEGIIIRLELRPPFSYLHQISQRVQYSDGSVGAEKTKTSTKAGQCSDYIQLCEAGGIRTHTPEGRSF